MTLQRGISMTLRKAGLGALVAAAALYATSASAGMGTKQGTGSTAQSSSSKKQ
jgi:hypothetical protein